MNLKSLFNETNKKIYVINLYGPIVENDTSMFNQKFSAFSTIQELYDIANKQKYDGIIIRINS